MPADNILERMKTVHQLDPFVSYLTPEDEFIMYDVSEDLTYKISYQKLIADIDIGSIQYIAEQAEAAAYSAERAATVATNAANLASSASAAAMAASEQVGEATYRQQVIYISKPSGTLSVDRNEIWLTDTSGQQNRWTTVRPVYNKNYPVLFVAVQKQTLEQSSGTSCSCTTPVKDQTTTVIDAGHITTGSIDATLITTNKITSSQIDTNTITVGSLGDGADYYTATQIANIYATQLDFNAEVGQRKARFGTQTSLESDATVQTKAITCAHFELIAGSELTIYFKYANTYTNGAVKLNINETGAKNIWVANTVTSESNQLLWGAGAFITFRYDGEEYIVIGQPRIWYGASTSAADSQIKTDTTGIPGCVICKGTKIELGMTENNTHTSPLLNIQNTGNKSIFYGTGASGSVGPTVANGHSWIAGNTAIFTFDGYCWRMQGQTVISGDNITTGMVSANYLDVEGIVRIGGIASTGSIPTSLSQLINDAGFLTTTTAESLFASKQDTLTNVSSKNQYYLSTSTASAEGSLTGWQDTIPTWSSGKYIWIRVATTVTPIVGNSTTTYTPSENGQYDSNLTTALADLQTKASTTDAAATVVTTQEYYLSTSDQTLSGDTWKTTVPSWTQGKYIWTRFKIEKTTVAGVTTTSYSPSENGIYDGTLTTQISTAIDNIEIGGRNLLNHSETIDLTVSPYEYSTATTYSVSYGGQPSYFCSGPKYIRVDFPPLESGKEYVFSFDATSSNAQPVFVTIDDRSVQVGTTSASSGKWTRFTHKFTATGTGIYALIRINNANTSSGDSSYVAAFRNFQLEYGNMATDWTPSPQDVSAAIADAQAAAAAASSLASSASFQQQLIYISKPIGTLSVQPKTDAWVTASGDTPDTWSVKYPTYNSDYPVVFVAIQRKSMAGNISCSIPVKDDTTTVIDGGHIITGTVDATKISVTDLAALGATIGGFEIDSDSIHTVDKNGVDDSTPGIYLDSDGQISIGNNSKYLVFYKDSNNQWKIRISADDIIYQNEDLGSALSDANLSAVHITSSQGDTLRNNTGTTTLSVTVYHRNLVITNQSALVAEYGNTAYLKWYKKNYGENSFTPVSSGDSHLSNNGFTYTLSANDVNTQVTFEVELITD